ncbi:MAG: glycoside hydrolase family 1 protein [Bellilinea sp.]
MPQAVYHFPNGFLWGTATSSHQVEGNNTNNNWSAWEAEEGRIKFGHKAGLACDWWGGRWKEDFDRAADTAQNAHRLSIEWSRIQPKPDMWNEEALNYYREIIRGLEQRNMTPLVTLHHFSDPLWLVEIGGWENPDVPALFEKYTAKVVEALKDYVSLWVTINEPNVYAYGGYLGGGFPPGKNDLAAAFTVLSNMVRAHAVAYRTIHRIQKHARVGIALNYRSFAPARPALPFDRWMAGFLHSNFNLSFIRAITEGVFRFALRGAAIPEAAKTQDYLGINYYSRDFVAFKPLAFKSLFHKLSYPKDADLSDTGFIANIPEGMFEALKWANGFKLPIIVTENGVEDADDHLRPRYTVQHIHQVWRAVNFNFPIKGYFHWSLVDNFEWERGWTQRFGLWGLDPETQVRTRRPSVDVYADICQRNGIASEMVERYAPEAFSALFPA